MNKIFKKMMVLLDKRQKRIMVVLVFMMLIFGGDLFQSVHCFVVGAGGSPVIFIR